jgi:hypothetical protein
MSEKLEIEKCVLKIVDGKAIVECPNAESVAEAVVAISKGVNVIQVEAMIKPSVEKVEAKKAEKK